MMRQAQSISGPQFTRELPISLTVELHNSVSPYNIVHTFSNINLNTDGSLSIAGVLCNIYGDYYIVIKHRNSIETWSSVPVNFGEYAEIIYDFTTAASKAYGNNLKPIGSVYTIFCADASIDGIVDGTDMAMIDNASNAPPLMGYHPEDINGDGIVDGTDMALIDNNSVSPPAQVNRPK